MGGGGGTGGEQGGSRPLREKGERRGGPETARQDGDRGRAERGRMHNGGGGEAKEGKGAAEAARSEKGGEEWRFGRGEGRGGAVDNRSSSREGWREMDGGGGKWTAGLPGAGRENAYSPRRCAPPPSRRGKNAARSRIPQENGTEGATGGGGSVKRGVYDDQRENEWGGGGFA